MIRSLFARDSSAETVQSFDELDKATLNQILYLNPTETTMLERAMAITGGRRRVIVADVKEPLPTG